MPSEYAHIRFPGQDDYGIDHEGLRRQQLEVHAVGVTPDFADAEQPDALQAQNHVVGPARRRRVGHAEVGGEEVPVYGLAQVDLVTGIRIVTGKEVALPAKEIPNELHVGDLPQVNLTNALQTEDLAETDRGSAINQVRKGPTTRLVHQIR